MYFPYWRASFDHSFFSAVPELVEPVFSMAAPELCGSLWRRRQFTTDKLSAGMAFSASIADASGQCG
jgi:hypothetical protein